MHSMMHTSREQLIDGLEEIGRSPADHGSLEAIVIRPAVNERRSLASCRLSPELGVDGDNWSRDCWMKLPDGSSNPDVQVSIINSRLIQLVAGMPDRWQLAGDNLYADLDLSKANLPPGTRLRAGAALLEITEEEHRGCKKFAQRYGEDAVDFVNGKEHWKLNLRGVYARVITAGVISLGDEFSKV